MNGRAEKTIAAYVGSTLSLMNNNDALLAAKELGTKKVNELDVFFDSLSKEIQDELEPLVSVLRDPTPFMLDGFNDAKILRSLILKQIRKCTVVQLQQPQKPADERSLELVIAENQQRREALRISPTTGRDRSYNIATAEEAMRDNLRWFYTREGQAYLYNQGHLFHPIPHGVGVQGQALQNRAIAPAFAAIPVEQDYGLTEMLMSFIMPTHGIYYGMAEPHLRNYPRVRNASWYLSVLLALMTNTIDMVENYEPGRSTNTMVAGVQTSLMILSFLQGFAASLRQEPAQPRATSRWSSLWHYATHPSELFATPAATPQNDAPVVIEIRDEVPAFEMDDETILRLGI